MKLYFHIGQPKTGSSAIQSFLFTNRVTLAANNKIFYPGNEADYVHTGLEMNHSVFFKKAKVDENDYLQKYMHACMEYSSKHGIEKIVFSCELFGCDWLPGLLSRIISIAQTDYNVILYLRRQDHYIEAAWKQWGVKMGVKNIQGFCEISNVDWFKMISDLTRMIEPEKIILRSYEAESIGQDVVADFMKVLGVNDLMGLGRNLQDNNANNHGFSPDVIEIMRLSQGLTKGLHDNTLTTFLSNMLPEVYRKSPMTRYNLLSPGERIEILKKFADGNKQIARMYWGEERDLFLEPWPDPDEPFELYQGLTTERATPILMEIIMSLNKKIERISQFLKKRRTIQFTSRQIYNGSAFSQHVMNPCLKGKILEFDLVDNKGFIYLPPVELPSTFLSIRFDITVPAQTTLTLFYRQSIFRMYDKKHCVRLNLKSGRQYVLLEIPGHQVRGRLKLNPGTEPGRYALHFMEISM